MATAGRQQSNSTLRAQQIRASVINTKYNLSKWKYSDIRDTINTSSDSELLNACRDEFQRRLKVYHTWKSKSRNLSSQADDEMRTPHSILLEAVKQTSLMIQEQNSMLNQPHRFFKIHFSWKNDVNVEKKGWWYAHYKKNWIMREMEIKSDQVPILLLAGKDDSKMCDLSLIESGLTRRQDAEITDEEFECEWSGHGGTTHASSDKIPTDNQQNSYFKIPFSDDKNGLKCWWFAHFENNWIVRQMTIRTNQPPILLGAGKEDLKMCELSLIDTGLMRRRDVEITKIEFEHEWVKNGGQAYTRLQAPNNIGF